MSKFLLDSDVIIWHLRGREKVTKMLGDSFDGIKFYPAI